MLTEEPRSETFKVQKLMGNSSQDVVPELGALHRWENISLKVGLKGITTLTSAEASPLEKSPSCGASALLENDSGG